MHYSGWTTGHSRGSTNIDSSNASKLMLDVCNPASVQMQPYTLEQQRACCAAESPMHYAVLHLNSTHMICKVYAGFLMKAKQLRRQAALQMSRQCMMHTAASAAHVCLPAQLQVSRHTPIHTGSP
jgi:spore maturation protein SpmA